MKGIILVEDTYGVGFHKELIGKLREVINELRDINNPPVDRIPAKECNPAIARKARARLLKLDPYKAKVLIVVDSEGQTPTEVKDRIIRHFGGSKPPGPSNVRVVVVDPRHEAWLCIGLGFDRSSCRKNPEDTVVREKRLNSYKKWYLEDWAGLVDVGKLQNESDFKEYLDALKWLLEDP